MVIFFYWDGNISDSRRQILNDSVYSTRVFNPNHRIVMVSNSLKQEDFDPKFNIEVWVWGFDIFDDLPIPREFLEKHYTNAHPREFSDLIRIIYLYKFGGSYVDTDDLAIKPLPEVGKNIVCRSYDPHTCHYNNLTPKDCLPGDFRDISGYDHIPMFPRNDCWLNFEPKSKFIHTLLSNNKIVDADKALYIGDGVSWQSLTLETCKKTQINLDYTFGLTLLYLYEDFVAASSYWDRCDHGGEMCDLYNKFSEIKNYAWGFHKCSKKEAMDFYNEVFHKYSYLSHMWLHSKDMKEEWFIDDLNIDDKYSVSTWIYDDVKQKIKCFQ